MFQRVAGFIKRHPIWTLILALALVAIIYRVLTPTPPTYEYVSEAVGRGEVVSKVTASGKLRALNTVKVGAEVSGQVMRVTVDFNSPVKAGQVLAEIDPTRFRARVLQAEAQVSLGRAALAQAEASLTRAQTDVGIQQREFSRRRQLSNQGYISKAGLDGAVGQLSSAQAGYRTAVAQVASARAQIQQSSA
jgi:HlyD family secretion protein